jgi:hypothetical protein
MSQTYYYEPLERNVKINIARKKFSFVSVLKNETKNYVTSPRSWTCDFLLLFYVISLPFEAMV